MLTLQQAVVPHLKVTGTAAGLPTAHWSVNYTPHTVVPPCSSILWPPRVHNVIVSGCTHCDVVNQTLQIRRIAFDLRCVKLLPVSDVRHQYRSDTDYYQLCCCDVVRAERRHVREVEVEKWLRATPSKSKGSTHLFRNLTDKGQTSSCVTVVFILFLYTHSQCVDSYRHHR